MTAGLLSEGDVDHAWWAIVLTVLAAHAAFLALLTMQASYTPMPPAAPRRVVVKTVALQPPAPAAAAAASQPLPSKPAAKKPAKAAPADKKSAKPVAAQPKAAPSKERISKIQDNLSKINTKPLQNMPVVEVPDSLTALSVEALPDISWEGATSAEVHYRDEVARRLRAALTLPERGEVVVQLTIGRGGAVLKMSIVSAANQANRKYVEQRVPAIAFAPFGAYFGGEASHTFTVALRSE